MKKLLALTLTLVLLSTMVLPVAADNTTTLTIEYEQDPAAYTLVIPQDQAIVSDEFVDIGMVSVTGTSNFYGRHLKVNLNMTDFTGATHGASIPAFLRVSDGQEGVADESNNFNLYFRSVNDDGSLSNDAFSDQAEFMVNNLVVATYLEGNNAPTDTYTATITYTASVEYNQN